jgi:uncharacterized C2H2 Zn-finger protein
MRDSYRCSTCTKVFPTSFEAAVRHAKKKHGHSEYEARFKVIEAITKVA